MSEKPIIFFAPMVRALLDGRKTMTRRIIKADKRFTPSGSYAGDRWWMRPHSGGGWIATNGGPDAFMETQSTGFKCPYGQPGDTLWVLECWRPWSDDYPSVEYKADAHRTTVHCPTAWSLYLERSLKHHAPSEWRPSIHMPRWASRITLQVESVRVERVQEITESDAKAEGVPPCEFIPDGLSEAGTPLGYVTEFACLWDDIHGPGAWDRNEWVWCISFKRINP